MLQRLFRLKENNTDVKTEMMAGVTTFMTLSYIIFVQPTVLSACGMNFGAVLVATCVSSAVATFLMAFYANYPIALAPGMGQNFFFAYTVVLKMGIPWEKALGAVFLSGVLFLALSFFGFLEKLIDGIPDSLKEAIAVGIGLFIAMIGFQWSGIVVGSPSTLVGLGSLHSAPVLLSIFGLLLTVILVAARVRGALLMPFAFSITEGIAFGFIAYSLLKLITRRGGEVHGLVYLFAALFVIRYIYLQ